MKIYHQAQIAEVTGLTEDALAAVEAGFAALGRNEVAMPPVLSMNISESNGEVDVKTAHIRGKDRFAIKVSPGFFDNPKLGLPSLNGLMVLFSAKTGLVDSVLFDEGYLTNIRTALAGAIAAKHLSRPDSRSVTVIGAGRQAELQVAALTLVRPIREVHVFARNADKMAAYQKRMAQQYGLPVTVHTSAASACAAADIVVTTTPTSSPVLHWTDLRPGTHVTAMGSDNSHKQELEPAILANADVLVVDRRAQSEVIGELHHFPGPFTRPVFELGQVVAEHLQLRTNAQQITVCDLSGTGVQDTAIANYTADRLNG
ncbi:cyclodeaminase [Oceanimonas baumannii]|uniref:cyclodeaminase n=1 Tax=Oceanimonas baumannii TaxID=129578 RepID=UPI00224C1AA8|nr:cyclodeaminase [Oceanimonas baumannii]